MRMLLALIGLMFLYLPSHAQNIEEGSRPTEAVLRHYALYYEA